MPMIAREFLQITQETAYKVPNASPVLNTNRRVIRLDTDNSFTMRATPVTEDVIRGGGDAVPAYSVSDQIALTGKLSLKLTYKDAKILLPWCCTRINAGQTLPWVTTEPPNDLASMCIDHAIYYDDTAAYKRTRYLGVKPMGADFSVSRSQRIATLDIDLIGAVYQGNPFDASSDPDATAFPLPAETDFATDAVVFGHFGLGTSTSKLTIGSDRTRFESIKFGIKNVIDARPFESRFVQVSRCCGRSWTGTTDLMLVSTPTDRLSHEQLTAQNVKAIATNGTNTITLDFGTANLIRPIGDQLANERIYLRNVGLGGFYDVTNTKDIVFTYA